MIRRWLRQTVRDPLLAAGWARVRRQWQAMAAWSLLLWTLTVVVLVPVTSAVIHWRLHRAGSLVIGNEELLGWLLTPAGAMTVWLVGAAASLNWILRYAGIFVLITDDIEGRAVGFGESVWRLARSLPALLRFALKAVALVTVMAAPGVAGYWAIGAMLLRQYDLNYYLFVRPVEWYVALGLAVIWSLVWLGAALYLLERVILALPSWLDGYRGFTTALRRSWSLTRARSGRLVRVLFFLVAGWILLRVIADFSALTLAAVALEALGRMTSALWPVVVGTGAFLGLSLLLDLLIDFLGFSLLATVLTSFYHEHTRLHRHAPEPPPLPSAAHRWLLALQGWLNPRRVILLALLTLAASAFTGYQLLQRLPPARVVLVTAHRAGPPPAPENSLGALEAAIAAGADQAEIDVMRTRDGVVVVTHDADLMRVAGDPRTIAATRFIELQSVQLRGPDGVAPAERRLATLGEFLARARGRIRLQIELKYFAWDPLLVGAVVQEIRAEAMEAEVMLMSLNLEAVRQVQAVAPDLTVGYISTVAMGAVERLPVDFLALQWRRLSPTLIRNAHRRGQAVHVWTVNDAALMADVMERGVDGVITDDPALAVRVRDELATLSVPERLLLRFFRKLLLPEPELPRGE